MLMLDLNGERTVVAPYWTSRLRQVDITATLQNYPSVEAVEMVEQAFPGTVITPTRSLNITWAYSGTVWNIERSVV